MLTNEDMANLEMMAVGPSWEHVAINRLIGMVRKLQTPSTVPQKEPEKFFKEKEFKEKAPKVEKETK